MHRLLPFVLLLACTDLETGLPPPIENPTIVAIAATPSRTDGRVSPITRLSIELSVAPIAPRVVVIGGGAEAEEVVAIAKNRATSALRAKELPTVSWVSGPRVHVQPSRALPAGRSTLIVLQDKRAPLTAELEVEDQPSLPARRVWTSATTVTHCAARLPELPSVIELAPSGAVARVVRLHGVPCFDAIAPSSIAGSVLPPELSGLTLDPSPMAPPDPPPKNPEPPCPEASYPLGPLCVRVDDDRLTFVGGSETARLVLGRVGPFEVLQPLPIGAREIVRGFPPQSPVALDLVVRDVSGEHRVAQTVTTRARRRHVVINEVLSRPPSGAATQRFLELVNDGDAPVDLTGLVLRDGDSTWELPDVVLLPMAFALITAEGYVDGLAGEIAPPKGVERILVDSLRLSGEISISEPTGAVLSRFPPTTSTRTIARGRRTPGTPDDAPAAFGWDANGRATPGRANVIEP